MRHAQVRIRRAGRRIRPRTARGSTRIKVIITKVKIATPSSGRAAAASCGSARPTNRLATKPCVPYADQGQGVENAAYEGQPQPPPLSKPSAHNPAPDWLH